MKFKLIITNTARKSLVFISDGFKLLTLEESISEAKAGRVGDVFVVSGKGGEYLRLLPNQISEDNIDSKSVTIAKIFKYLDGFRKFSGVDIIDNYVRHHNNWIKESGQPFILSVDDEIEFTDNVRNLIKLHKELFKEIGKEFGIDPYLLAAIVIDETVRLSAFERLGDEVFANLVGRNTSVGIAQIKIDTANDLIIDGYYNPNPQDKNLPIPKKHITNIKRSYLFNYLVQPKHNIRFEAAQVKNIIDHWSDFVDLSTMPEIIGTLYSQGLGNPKHNPASIPRGDQIAGEFYDYAKKWLK